MSTSQLTARLYGPASTVGAAAWNACANPEGSDDPHPFTRYEFFAACEESGSATARNGWRPCHLAIEQDEKIVGLLPLYLKNHSQGEYVFDQGWADAFARAGGSYYPKLQASVPFTPVTGKRFLVARGVNEADVRKALMGAAATAAEELDASSVRRPRHDPPQSINFFDEMSFANPSNSRVTRHLAYGFHIMGEQQGTRAHSGRG